MAKTEYTLSPDEIEILVKGQDDPDYITGYFFRPDGEEDGWQFDKNFTDKGKWQKSMHSAVQSLIMVIGGVGTGKTLGVGMSAAVWCILCEDFKFLNVAQKEWQARLMYDLILDRARGTIFEKLIWSAPQRPYPKIILRFRIGKKIVQSSMEFMSVDGSAKGIFSWRGDWINIEEAGLLDNLDELAMNLSTRLTGNTRSGRAFLGRMSMISNPWDTPHLWYLFDMAANDPENNLSMVISTRDNKNVTEKQIQDLLKHIPEDERPRLLDGLRPEGKGSYFSKESIYACEEQFGVELALRAVNEGKTGYSLQSLYGAGVTEYRTPKVPGRMYFILGDPGTEGAPGRNAPVIGVWDVTEFPLSPMTLIGFWWGNGNGNISPFVDRLLDWNEIYKPFLLGIDSTGPQKNMADILNVQYFNPDENIKYNEFTGIQGLDFSGPKKATYLVALRLMIESRRISWPKGIVGIRAQLANYDPLKDKAGAPKISQDIVSMMAMSAFAVRAYFNVSYEDLIGDNSVINEEIDPITTGWNRLAGEDRAKRNSLWSRESQIRPR